MLSCLSTLRTDLQDFGAAERYVPTLLLQYIALYLCSYWYTTNLFMSIFIDGMNKTTVLLDLFGNVDCIESVGNRFLDVSLLK